ncbi:aquaporin family protein [Kaistella flava (ex Peng et al. 2021)]|uniref:Aquaporin family protein n=1 Tax=Kaistella flava (ex Peng et al. 2021) TaxID=2038776 RepID=A0A7M2Y7C9_9FLAO|nr:aquaporin [Kaistella flava (ex Peng et al. 2021)]QOW09312.1 aquaporin family protein [Kaistella flava (ex Peng et al. 2021)]
MLKSLRKNYILFLQEGLGLFIFMISACFFAGNLEHQTTVLHLDLPNPKIRLLVMAIAMATTALFIFLSPLTSPSGAFINPAVSIMRWRLGQLSLEKLIWYSVFQTIGGLLAVYIMKFLMGNVLSDPPVNYVATVPGKNISDISAALMETVTAFVMIAMVLFLSDSKFSKTVPYLSALLVGVYVYIAGPVSGFGMNPARTIASAVPANIYTSFWIYMLCPTIGMLAAAELYLQIKHKKPFVDLHLDDN